LLSTQANGGGGPALLDAGQLGLNPGHVDPAVPDLEGVTAGPPADPHARIRLGQRAPDPREIDLQGVPGALWWSPIPHPVDQRRNRHRPAHLDRERGQNTALPRRPGIHRTPSGKYLHRTQ
jgi:hypothetical protein